MMRHVAPMLLATGLVATMLGCQSQTTEQKAKPGVEYTLVSLKVPNMVWGGCKASVRGAVTDAGYVEFNGDVPSRTCSFKVPQDADYEAKLAALAKTNGHIKGYTIQ